MSLATNHFDFGVNWIAIWIKEFVTEFLPLQARASCKNFVG